MAKVSNEEVTFRDKITELLSIKDKLVYVQVCELENILMRASTRRDGVLYAYVETLYDHYITKGLPKTYLAFRH